MKSDGTKCFNLTEALGRLYYTFVVAHFNANFVDYYHDFPPLFEDQSYELSVLIKLE